jgi:hypothetical protein
VTCFFVCGGVSFEIQSCGLLKEKSDNIKREESHAEA